MMGVMQVNMIKGMAPMTSKAIATVKALPRDGRSGTPNGTWDNGHLVGGAVEPDQAPHRRPGRQGAHQQEAEGLATSGLAGLRQPIRQRCNGKPDANDSA